MQLEPRARTEQSLRISPKLITSSAILHLSADELERAVEQEQVGNPVLEVDEQRVCLFCGSAMYGQTCTNCGHFGVPTQPLPIINEESVNYDIPAESLWSASHQTYDMDNYAFFEADRDEDFDPLASIPAGETLAQLLLRQLEALITPGEEEIAEHLVGNLNDRGYLEHSVQEIAGTLSVPVERVEYVLHQLQTLEPLGIGARDLRECLLIQLQAIDERREAHTLARVLIDRYLERLGRGQFQEIARELNVAEAEVRQASTYIRTTLHPFPAYTYSTDIYSSHAGSDATYIRPDVIIRAAGEGLFEVELIEEKRYHFSISTDHIALSSGAPASAEMQQYFQHNSDRAKFFIDCVQRRWRTLKRVMELVVDYQREFLERGVRYLRPLTRAEVATRLNVDEGTVSRATANKYALLPNGRLMPISDFFDSSLSIKDVLRELIASEDAKHRLSDDELARLLQARGIPMARRTVTKYREEMGIGSSRER
jgi:RNA polymerase sigma-54 factor